MRDLLVLLLGLGIAGAALRRPFYGALGWVLFSVMNPHRLTYGFAYDFPFALMMVGATLIGLVVGSDKKVPKGGAAAVVLLLIFLWMLVTTFDAFHPVAAGRYLERTGKSFLMTVVLLLLVNSKRDVVMLVAVLVASLAIFGAKGGVFVMATGGNYMVNGPPDSVMDGNNALGVGLTMCIPLLYFLQTQTRQRWQRHALSVVMVLCAIAVLGTYSRGALLAVAAMALLLWLRSRHKLMIAVVVAGFMALAIPNMPDQWLERMNTISSHEEDASAMGRIYAWHTATNIAVDRFPLAGGFEWHGLDTSAKYSPMPDSVLVAHSNYFQVLGSQGFIGLILFLTFWVMVYRQCAWLRRHGKSDPQLLWAFHLGSMAQVSLLGYAVGGAFLDLAFWDLPYYLFAAVAGAMHLMQQRGTTATQATAGPPQTLSATLPQRAMPVPDAATRTPLRP